MSELRFAPVQPEDIDAVIEIERRSFSSPWSVGLFRHELKVPFSKITGVWLANGHGEHLAGYVCRWLVGEEIHILNLAVHPDHRRCGIGQGLVEVVLEEAAGLGISQVTLEVREANAAARRLYETMGFSESGRRRNYYGRGEDAIIMMWGRRAGAR